MRRAALVLALGAAGCSTSHTLAHPPRLPSALSGCSIGVGSIMDDAGVDHALDLRDYLRASGPCRRVTALVSLDDDDLDLVITGKVSAQLAPPPLPPVYAASSRALGAWLGLAIGGAVLYGVAAAQAPAPDAAGFVSPSARSLQKGMMTAGVAGLAIGGVLAGGTIGLMIADEKAIREVALEGTVNVVVTLLRQGRPVDELREHDEVTAYGKHPAGRPEPRTVPAASAPLYREAMERVFEHIASRAADAIQAAGAGPAPR